jgi:hypothetical protein
VNVQSKGGDKLYQKIIATQHVIEVYEYEKLNINGKPDRDGDGLYSVDNYKARLKERKNKIRRLITTNFDSQSKFVTLTFRDTDKFDIRNVKECNKYFRYFVMRMKKKYPDFKYVSVIEFQDKNDRGAIHYHMICNLPYIKKSELSKIWGHGFVKINAIDKVDNVGAYVIKYMTSDMSDVRLQGENGYLRSTGLEIPSEAKSWRSSTEKDAIYEFAEKVKNISPSYAATFESEKAGKIIYQQYNMKRINSQDELQNDKTDS